MKLSHLCWTKYIFHELPCGFDPQANQEEKREDISRGEHSPLQSSLEQFSNT